MALKPAGELKFRVFQDPSKFGYQIQLYISGREEGKIQMVTEMRLVDVEPGQVIPEKAVLPVDEGALRELGQYLVGQGLITAPVTDRERKEHDELKVKYEMQDKLIDQMREQLKDSNARLNQIAGVVELAKNQIEKK